MLSSREAMSETQDLGRALAALLAQRAPRYFEGTPSGAAGDRQPQLASTRAVKPTGVRERRFSTFFDFEIETHPVLVKVPSGRRHSALARSAGSGALPESLRLAPRVAPEQKGLREYRALLAMEQHFRALSDRRFGTVPVLDFLPEFAALCMERVAAEGLERRLNAARWMRNSAAQAVAACGVRNAGSWLRIFHASPPLEHTRSCSEQREELIDSLLRFVEYLEPRGAAPDLVRLLRECLPAAAHAQLPEPLPLGLSHGDFAPRNLLCDAAGRVTALDTQAGWRAPIYADLAHFLVAVEATPLRLFGGIRIPATAFERSLRSELLAGYFGAEPAPRAALALFEIQEWLARWAAIVHHADAARGLRRAAKSGRRLLASRSIAGCVAACVEELTT